MVPPLASAIHQTYSAIAKPHATGMSTPQTPMPFTNSQVQETISTASRNSEIPKPMRHHNGARCRSTLSPMWTLSEVRVTSGRITGASGKAAGVTTLIACPAHIPPASSHILPDRRIWVADQRLVAGARTGVELSQQHVIER